MNSHSANVADHPSTALPPVLTVDEVAGILRVDRKTAYAAIAEHKLPGVRRFGRCIRVSRDALLEWLSHGIEPARASTRR